MPIPLHEMQKMPDDLHAMTDPEFRKRVTENVLFLRYLTASISLTEWGHG